MVREVRRWGRADATMVGANNMNDDGLAVQGGLTWEIPTTGNPDAEPLELLTHPFCSQEGSLRTRMQEARKLLP
jgi:hypothetical protein